MTHESNRVLECVLEELLQRHRKASAWVHDGAELEATGEVLMGELVSGDLRAIERMISWVQTFDGPIPAVPVPGSTPRTWTLTIDEASLCTLDKQSADVVRGMHHLLFGGPAPQNESPILEDLASLGLPPGLREDIERA
jgi:hypothetical protein